MNFLPEPWMFFALAATLAVGAGLAVWLIPLRGVKFGIYLGIGAAVLSLFGLIAHEYESRGKADIQAKWDEDKAARIKRTTDITNELYAQIGRKDGEARALQARLDATFSGIRAGGLTHVPNAPVALSGATAGVFDDASRAANSARPDAGTKAGADSVPAAAETKVVYDERELASWVVDAAGAYADAYQLWRSCRSREDQYLIAMKKGAEP